MWIVECKAHSRSTRVDRADYIKLKGRSELLGEDLDQARTLADFVRDNPTGRNYATPGCVEKIDYCVVTPEAEWIWTEDKKLWLSDTVPRICTMDEILAILAPQTK